MPVEYHSNWDDETLGILAHLHQEALPFQGWNAPSLKSILTSSGAHMQIAFVDTSPVGFILYRDTGDAIELLTLAVSPTQQRQGIGKHLVYHMLSHFPSHDTILEVASDNIAAQQLYLALGFEQIHIRKAYYFRGYKPAADALIFKHLAISQPSNIS
jgi:[ribosomal protein S18]-alanine N-acetyltransferase